HSGIASACGHVVLRPLPVAPTASAAQRVCKSRQWRKKSIQYPSEPASYDKSLSAISTSILGYAGSFSTSLTSNSRYGSRPVKFLIDRCAGHRLAEWLRAQGHDVVESRERGPD